MKKKRKKSKNINILLQNCDLMFSSGSKENQKKIIDNESSEDSNNVKSKMKMRKSEESS
jgi:hypothetical protein